VGKVAIELSSLRLNKGVGVMVEGRLLVLNAVDLSSLPLEKESILN
jgi:hypothetical protein